RRRRRLARRPLLAAAMSVRVVVTTPLEDDLLERISEADERVDLVVPRELIAAPAFPSAHPFPAPDERWDALLDSAEVLFDFGPIELAPRLASRPHLRWIQATSAGVGRLVERVGLQKSDVVVTTASGVHARALA